MYIISNDLTKTTNLHNSVFNVTYPAFWLKNLHILFFLSKYNRIDFLESAIVCRLFSETIEPALKHLTVYGVWFVDYTDQHQ